MSEHRVSTETVSCVVLGGWGSGESRGGSWDVFLCFGGDLRFKGGVWKCECCHRDKIMRFG